MYLAVTIPEDLLGRLRAGARKLVLAVVIGPQREWEGEESARFCRVCRLLDTIGWQPGEVGPEVMIDIADHALALHEALVRALRDAVIELHALERGERQDGIREFAELVDAASRLDGGRDIHARRRSDQAEAPLADVALADDYGPCAPWRGGGRPRGRLPGLSLLAGAARRRERGCPVA